MSAESLVFKIVAESDWREARACGAYAGSEVDLRDGFIHFSATDQVESTAEKWFAGRTDLLLVAVDATALADAMRWEVSRGGALFPHLYAPLPMSAVVWERPLTLDNAGRFKFGRLSR